MSNEEEIPTKKKRRAHTKGRFVESFPDEQCCVLGDLSRDIEKAYDELESHNNEYMEMLDEQNDSDKLLELQKDMDSTYKELYDVKSQLSRKITESKAEESKPNLKNRNQAGLKVKKLDGPEFSGIIRDYPSFKRDYEQHMLPSFGQDPFALKKIMSEGRGIRHSQRSGRQFL